MSLLPPIPRNDDVVKPDRKISDAWDTKFLQELVQHVEQAPYTLAHVVVNSSATNVGPVNFVPPNTLDTAFYRISYALRVARAATVSSSIQLLIEWTSNGIAQMELFAAMTGNTTTTRQDDVYCFRSDKNAAITYTLAYLTIGATSVQFNADITLELMPDPRKS